MIKEKWVEIPEYEGLYMISDMGNIKSIRYKRSNRSQVLKPVKTKKGYLRVLLSKGEIRKNLPVHRLVLKAFVGDSNLLVDHINGIKSDNRLDNLRYCTNRENMSFINVMWPKKKTSVYTGVYYEANRNRYRASIKINGRSIHLGRFKDEKAAGERYQQALKEYGFK